MLKKFHDGAANEAYIFAAISRPLLKSDDIEVLKWYRMEKVLQKLLSFVMERMHEKEPKTKLINLRAGKATMPCIASKNRLEKERRAVQMELW